MTIPIMIVDKEKQKYSTFYIALIIQYTWLLFKKNILKNFENNFLVK